MTLSGKTLDEWIAYGRETGKIKDVLTVIWAYSLPEADAITWVAAIVNGETTERAALTSVRSRVPTGYRLDKLDWLSLNALPGRRS